MENYYQRIREVLVLSILLFMASPSSAQNKADNLYFEEYDGTARIVRGEEEYEGNIIIPETIVWYDEGFDETREYIVRSIASDAFMNCKKLISVTLPNTIVDENSFGCYYGCSSLQKIVLPSGITKIGERNSALVDFGPFQGCSSLKSINLSNAVTFIGMKAFCGCTSLTLDFPEDITYIGDSAFVGCTFTSSSISIPFHDTDEHGDIFCIGMGAFYKTNIESINYNTMYLRDLGGSQHLKKLIIGPQVEYIELMGMPYPLESLIVDKGNSIYDSRENCNAVIETATNELIMGCGVSTIPASVNAIRQYAFMDCKSLKKINLPTTLTTIGFLAFKNSGLEEVTIPASFDEEGEGQFEDCHNLKSVTLPEGMTFIPFDMFMNCDALESITIPSTVKEIGKYTFNGCTALQSVKSLAKQAPYIRSNSFSKETYTNAILYIRNDAQNYTTTDWSRFKNVVKFDWDGVSIIKSERNEQPIYDLNGRPASKLKANGIYIQGGRKLVNSRMSK